jgi:hypothetical protein
VDRGDEPRDVATANDVLKAKSVSGKNDGHLGKRRL